MATKGKVRDFIKRLRAAGFEQVKASGRLGDHRKFKNAEGRTVQVSGKASDDIHPKLWGKMLRDAGIEE